MIHYLIGSAVEPLVTGPKIICHICNDIGAWGAGFVLAVSKKWPQPEAKYRALTPEKRQLGYVQLIPVTPDIYVANMIAQHDTKPMYAGGYGAHNSNSNPIPPIRYDALRTCLRVLQMDAHSLHASVHMPRIGCGLAGGDWKTVEKLIQECLPDIEVYVYDLPQVKV